MSRSNPQESAPNPAVRWFEWNGEKGLVRYYDKDSKQNVDVPLPFSFMLLDQLAGVGGWHDASDSGIYSNQVKDTRADVLVVKSFKGGILAEGLYKDIKDRVAAQGGQFVAQCYIAFKNPTELAIAVLRIKGAALREWMEFTRDNRSQLYKGAVTIPSFTEGKKGSIKYRVPVLKLAAITEASNNQAVALDAQLQEWLDGYLRRTKAEQVEHHENEDFDQSEPEPVPAGNWGTPAAAITDDDIPF
jgi:hypothetical protein